MLYILPPPSAPQPPSPWAFVRREGSGDSNNAYKRFGKKDSGAGSSLEEDEPWTNRRNRLNGCYFTLKGAVVSSAESGGRMTYQQKKHKHNQQHGRMGSKGSPIVAGVKVGLSGGGGRSQWGQQQQQQQQQRKDAVGNQGDIQQHLQSMFAVLRPEETLKMAVKLESVHPDRTRYLVVVSCLGRSQTDECCLLGIDCNEKTTIGLVLKVLADTAITLDGDGGFSVSVCQRQHIFKPVSVQAMWSALQTLHRVSLKARDCNYFEGGGSHEWVAYYEQRIQSDRSRLNEWHAMNDLLSKRPPSPDSSRSKPRERLETEAIIRGKLKEIMMSVDLDEVTSKYIRTRLEEQLDMDLREFKSFIDEEMLVILGQMDEATQVFPHVYLGSEWNASNLEELQKNGVRHILNVSREIDNFFPGTFDYLNIRVYDDENTNLLKHWDNTYKFINKAKKEGSKVLVHCKMGISRSASVVIAYAMKAYNWDLKKAFDHVREKRSCIKPNQNFINQLETYRGILDAMKNREKLQRSKSETNLKRKSERCKPRRLHSTNAVEEEAAVATVEDVEGEEMEEGVKMGVDEEEEIAVAEEDEIGSLAPYSGAELAQLAARPKSWSPDHLRASQLFRNTGPTSQSMDHLNLGRTGKMMREEEGLESHSSSTTSLGISPPIVNIPPAPPLPPPDTRYYNLNVRMPCSNGLAYSVSQNKIVQLYSAQKENSIFECETIRTKICSKSKMAMDRRGLVLNLTSHFEKNTPLPSPSVCSDGNNLVKREDLETGVTTTCEGRCPKFKREADAFSARLDMDRESGRGKELIWKSCDISRQNSWSSHDSAVVLEYQGETRVSRQNSWGSCGSFASYKPAPPAPPPQPPHRYASSPSLARESIGSSDGGFKSGQSTGNGAVRYKTSILEKFCGGDKCGKDGGKGKRGLVHSLKREFEAKCGGKVMSPKMEDGGGSLPSSPVIQHAPSYGPSPAISMEDLSVRMLVGKYEPNKMFPPVPPRKSSLEQVQAHCQHQSKKVSAVAKSILTTAPCNEIVKIKNKLQHGKTHPLSKLPFCKRHGNNPAYRSI